MAPLSQLSRCLQDLLLTADSRSILMAPFCCYGYKTVLIDVELDDRRMLKVIMEARTGVVSASRSFRQLLVLNGWTSSTSATSMAVPTHLSWSEARSGRRCGEIGV